MLADEIEHKMMVDADCERRGSMWYAHQANAMCLMVKSFQSIKLAAQRLNTKPTEKSSISQ